MKGPIMRGNPCLNPYAGNTGALDEFQPPARRSTASFAPTHLPDGANSMLHKL
jgi:hypothetical protein